ncbi:MAG: SAM-dependent DNA methyltransferase [Oscillospiraceae bacterium]|nr:SAM-dependent DNA methyltransferase [Oscillospiraceae bacterium]
MAKTVRYRNEASADFIKVFQSLQTSRAAWEIWADFVTLTAAALSNSVDRSHYEAREAEYMTVIGKYTKSEAEVFPRLFDITVNALESDPEQDFLGSLYMALDLGNHWKGQFFTPYSVTKMMSSISMGDIKAQIEENGYITVNDCACGGGATLIAAANDARAQLLDSGYNWQNHILFTAQDIDYVTAKMCYIQLSLLGCAGYVKIGNTLTNPMHAGDDDPNYWYTPMYFSEVWHWRRAWRNIDKTLASLPKKPGAMEMPDIDSLAEDGKAVSKTAEEPLLVEVGGQMTLF